MYLNISKITPQTLDQYWSTLVFSGTALGLKGFVPSEKTSYDKYYVFPVKLRHLMFTILSSAALQSIRII